MRCSLPDLGQAREQVPYFAHVEVVDRVVQPSGAVGQRYADTVRDMLLNLGTSPRPDI
jgi:hypothetical protein